MSRALLLGLLISVTGGALAQDTLQEMPRYDRYEKLRREISNSVKRGTLNVAWETDSSGFTYSDGGKTFRFDVASKERAETAAPPKPTTPRRARNQPDRGRQFDTAFTADGKRKAVSRDWNVYVADADGKNEVPVTTTGGRAARIKFGVASWVYGEELDVREAMWWSPDGTKLAFYRFDENPVKDYFIAYNQVKIQDTLDTEAYPKAGADNPVVTLMIYDLASKKTTSVNTQFGDPTLGEYVYDVRWAEDGKELFFNRTNRKQNIMEFCATDPRDDSCRTVVRESQPQSWAENHPTAQFLADGQRFIWSSERNGYRNFYLYDRRGKLLTPLTNHAFDADSILRVDEASGSLWYMARSVASNPYLPQLHRVGLDGKNDASLTDPRYAHQVTMSPDGSYFVDVRQNLVEPPTTTLCRASGLEVAVLAESDLTKFNELKLRRAERFSFPSADGSVTLYGTLTFPSDFDPGGKPYPVLVSVYGGPESSGGAETFQVPNPITEFGFVCATFDGRGTNGRGKAFRDAVYGKLGIVEIDDQAAGVRALAERPYIDGKRVGIYGTSYGGYASLMCLLRHPETYAVSCSSSSVTDWRNYDSIYTERYMGLPWDNENKAGYDAAAAVTYAKDLTGKLMLYFGTSDNNVHPANTLQLVQKLESLGKRYDLQIGPDLGHTGMNATRMWEYFITNLIVRPVKDSLAQAYRLRNEKRRSSVGNLL